MDESHVKVRGEWMYLYRAVDKAGKTVDFLLSQHRDVNAAKAFLRRAMKGRRVPAKVTLDAYAASHRAVADLKKTGELPEQLVVRSSKYLNNLIEQDHRRIKQRLRPMLGLKSFESATIVISGITVQVGAVTLGNGKWLFLRDLTGRPWRVESARMMGERFVGLRYAVK
jgi:transposase-like protein